MILSDRDHREGVIKIRLTSCLLFSFKTYGRGERPIRLQNSPYFLLIQVRTREQSNEAENGEQEWEKALKNFSLASHALCFISICDV